MMNTPSGQQVPVELAIQALSSDVKALILTVKAMNEMMASHIRVNIQITDQIQQYMVMQLDYRAIREDVEASRLYWELQQKELEMNALQKKVDALQDENDEADAIRLEHEKAKLEIEKLRSMMEIQQISKNGTSKQRVPTIKGEKSMSQRAIESMVLTAVGVLTASMVGGLIAFFVFLFRQWIAAGTP